MRMDEGKQFFVNRITFTGNTTTHDNVIRREMRVAEGGVFNTEALKESVRRLNQLGYFKPLEKARGHRRRRRRPAPDGKVDIKLKFEEQNRNQLSFGAGVSQFDGFFGQLSFQTANFLGRGETVGVSLQKGSQAQQLPGVVQRAVPVRPADHAPASTSTRASTSSRCSTRRTNRRQHRRWACRCADYTRLFLGYSYDTRPRVRHQPGVPEPGGARVEPVSARLAADRSGRRSARSARSRRASSSTRSTSRSSRTRARATRSARRSRASAATRSYWSHAARGHLVQAASRNGRRSGLRAQGQYIRPYGDTIDAADLREVLPRRRVQRPRLRHPHDRPARSRRRASWSAATRRCSSTRSTTSTSRGPVRLVAFYDAGQVQDIGPVRSRGRSRSGSRRAAGRADPDRSARAGARPGRARAPMPIGSTIGRGQRVQDVDRRSSCGSSCRC